MPADKFTWGALPNWAYYIITTAQVHEMAREMFRSTTITTRRFSLSDEWQRVGDNHVRKVWP